MVWLYLNVKIWVSDNNELNKLVLFWPCRHWCCIFKCRHSKNCATFCIKVLKSCLRASTTWFSMLKGVLWITMKRFNMMLWSELLYITHAYTYSTTLPVWQVNHGGPFFLSWLWVSLPLTLPSSPLSAVITFSALSRLLLWSSCHSIFSLPFPHKHKITTNGVKNIMSHTLMQTVLWLIILVIWNKRKMYFRICFEFPG